MVKDRLVSLYELERRLGTRFKKISWLDRALTHKSFTDQSPSTQGDLPARTANEVLEFLGDAVLTLAISDLLIRSYPEAHEGTLSQWRAQLVRRSSLALLANELELEQFLLLGKGEIKDGGSQKSSILANTYEALIGAVYLDSGFDRALEIVESHFEAYLRPEMLPFHVGDYKSLFQEHTQRTHGLSPTYQVLNESGPDHDKRFQASVTVGEHVMGVGRGKTKKEAEQEAARKALRTPNPGRTWRAPVEK